MIIVSSPLLLKDVKKHNTNINGTIVKILKYDDKHAKTQAAKVRGYPTIHVETVGHDGQVTQTDYKGPRTGDAFIKHIMNIVS